MTQAAPIQPLGDRVVVTPLTATERMSGGVIIPDVAQEKPQQGIVVALGPEVGLKLRSASARCSTMIMPDERLSVGDRVLYGKYAGSEVTIDDVPYLVLQEGDVMGILPPLPPATPEAHSGEQQDDDL